MIREFFVMLYTQNGSYTPMMENDEDMAKYETIDDARAAAENSMLGSAFGYEVFQIGCGVQPCYAPAEAAQATFANTAKAVHTPITEASEQTATVSFGDLNLTHGLGLQLYVKIGGPL